MDYLHADAPPRSHRSPANYYRPDCEDWAAAQSPRCHRSACRTDSAREINRGLPQRAITWLVIGQTHGKGVFVRCLSRIRPCNSGS
ncbi:hypothetical protein I553_3390 [Mycobacterium xenopi 4042]|uniref:Uncharacterized protein n=1 Tax=Mycobacterium xenopi 4042 TaxID=1299334 RepID=X8BCC2_MYCXE|nr:hypothetical protein I553_3390 [Mycobacterium xenopi 4042]